MRTLGNKNVQNNNSENDLMYERLGNDMKSVIKLSKQKIHTNNNSSNRTNNSSGSNRNNNFITKTFQKCCYCFSTKRTVLGINTSNIGISNSAGFGTSYSLDSRTNDIILFVQSVGSLLGITGAVRENIWLIGLCTVIYSVMAFWCFFFLLDVGQAMYYTGIAYPNWLYIEELRNSSIDSSYQEDGSAEQNDTTLPDSNNNNTITPYYQHPDAVIMEQTPITSQQHISETRLATTDASNSNTSQQHISETRLNETDTSNSNKYIDIEAQPEIVQQGESNKSKRKWFRMFQRK